MAAFYGLPLAFDRFYLPLAGFVLAGFVLAGREWINRVWGNREWSDRAASASHWLVARGWSLVRPLMILLIGLSGGFAWSEFRLTQHRTLVDDEGLGGGGVSGHVVGVMRHIDFARHGYRADIEIRPGIFVRVFDRKKQLSSAWLGCEIGMRLRYLPPSVPAYPGAYDPRIRAFFDGEWRRGFLQKADIQGPKNCNTGWMEQIQRWRFSVMTQFVALYPASSRGVAMALIFGVRDLVPKAKLATYRDSGLAHMLAISGLHMALFAGNVYMLCRLLLIIVFSESRLRDARRPALVVAIIAGAFYLFMSGAGIATQRAFIMLCAALICIALYRPVLSLHNVALAAIMVLLIEPFAVRSPGFLMSFAAVISLISLAKWRPVPVGPFSKIGHYAVLLLLTSFVAGAVTGLIGLYYFQQAARYGLLANVLAVPIFSFVVMPSLAVSALLLDTPFAGPFIFTADAGLTLIQNIASYVSALPASLFYLPQQNTVFLLIVCGLVLLATQQKRPFWIGLSMGLTLLWVSTFFAPQRGDILIYGAGHHIAMRDQRGKLWMMRRASIAYIPDQWRRAEGVAALDVWTCGRGYCAFTTKMGVQVEWAWTLAAAAIACRQADLVISHFALPYCRAAVINLKNFGKADIHIVTVKGVHRFSCQSMADYGQREWHRWPPDVFRREGLRAKPQANSAHVARRALPHKKPKGIESGRPENARLNEHKATVTPRYRICPS